MPLAKRVRRHHAYNSEANGASGSGTVEQKKEKKHGDSLCNRAGVGMRRSKVSGSTYGGCSLKVRNLLRRNARKPNVNGACNTGSVERRKSQEKKLSDEEVSKIWTWLASQHVEADHKLDRIATRGLLLPSTALYSRCGGMEEYGRVGSDSHIALGDTGRGKINETVNAERLLNYNITTPEQNITDYSACRMQCSLNDISGENLALNVNKPPKNSHAIAEGKRLTVKLHSRARHRALTAEDVTVLFLPPGTTSPEEHVILLSEVLEVLEKDLGIFSTDKEREYIIDTFGLSDCLVDVKTFLQSCNMFQPPNIKKLDNHPTTSLELLDIDESVILQNSSPPCLGFHSYRSEENSSASSVCEFHNAYRNLSDTGSRSQRRGGGRTSISSIQIKPEKGAGSTTGERKLLTEKNECQMQGQQLNAFDDMGSFEELEELKFEYPNHLKKEMNAGNDTDAELRVENFDNSSTEEEYRCIDNILHAAIGRSKVVVENRTRGSTWGVHETSRIKNRWEGGRDISPLSVAAVEGEEYSPSNRGDDRKNSRSLTREQNGCWCCENNFNGMAIEYHEFKLVWEVVSGGMSALEEFRTSIMKLLNEGHVYLTVGQAMEALHKASYELSDWDINTLKMGMDTNENDDLNMKELLQMIEDIAIQSKWYTNVCGLMPPLDGMLSPPSISLYSENGVVYRNSKGSNLNGKYVPNNEHLNSNNEDPDFCFTALTVEDVITKVRQQLGLIQFLRFTDSTLAEQLGGAFYRRDCSMTGTLSLPDIRYAMEELGIKLEQDELRILACRFQQPLQPNDEEVLCTEVLAYTPVLQWLSREVCRRKTAISESTTNGKIQPAHNLRSVGKEEWYNRICNSNLDDSKKHVIMNSAEISGESTDKNRQELVNRLCKRFDDCDVTNGGKICRRDFLRTLKMEGFGLSKHEEKKLVSRLDLNNDGSVDWEEFLKLFEIDKAVVGGRKATYTEPWYATHADVVDEIITTIQQQQSGTSDHHYCHPPKLLLTLKQKFESYDVKMTGKVTWREFAASFKDCRNLNLNFEYLKCKHLFLALDRHGEGQARYKDLLELVSSRIQLDNWHKIEPVIAGSILKAMGIEPMQRYSWLSKFKEKNYEIDHKRTGDVCGKRFLEVLKECGVHFANQSEQRRLINVLGKDSNTHNDSLPKNLKAPHVSYMEVVDFCAKHAGCWQGVYPLLAEKIKDVMLKRTTKNGSNSKPIWWGFSEFDRKGNGTMSVKDLGSALDQLGLGDLSFSDRCAITEIVDLHESTIIYYTGLVRTLAEFDPLYETDQSLAIKLLEVLSERLGSGRSSSSGVVLHPEYKGNERKKDTNTIFNNSTRTQDLKQALSKIASYKGGMREEELERLLTCAYNTSAITKSCNVFASACGLLSMFVSRHLGAWAERLPHIASDIAFQFGLLPCHSTAVSKMERVLRIADRGGGTGKCGPAAFKRCLNGAGLDLTDTQIRDIMLDTTEIYGYIDNYVAYEAIMNFFRNMCIRCRRKFEIPENEAAPLASHLLEKFRDAVKNAVAHDCGGRMMNPGSKELYQSLRRWVAYGFVLLLMDGFFPPHSH